MAEIATAIGNAPAPRAAPSAKLTAPKMMLSISRPANRIQKPARGPDGPAERPPPIGCCIVDHLVPPRRTGNLIPHGSSLLATPAGALAARGLGGREPLEELLLVEIGGHPRDLGGEPGGDLGGEAPPGVGGQALAALEEP